MIYELKVIPTTQPGNIVFQQTFPAPLMSMNRGDYFTFGTPGAPANQFVNGYVLHIAHAIFKAPQDWVCSTTVVYDPNT